MSRKQNDTWNIRSMWKIQIFSGLGNIFSSKTISPVKSRESYSNFFFKSLSSKLRRLSYQHYVIGKLPKFFFTSPVFLSGLPSTLERTKGGQHPTVTSTFIYKWVTWWLLAPYTISLAEPLSIPTNPVSPPESWSSRIRIEKYTKFQVKRVTLFFAFRTLSISFFFHSLLIDFLFRCYLTFTKPILYMIGSTTVQRFLSRSMQLQLKIPSGHCVIFSKSCVLHVWNSARTKRLACSFPPHVRWRALAPKRVGIHESINFPRQRDDKSQSAERISESQRRQRHAAGYDRRGK